MGKQVLDIAAAGLLALCFIFVVIGTPLKFFSNDKLNFSTTLWESKVGTKTYKIDDPKNGLVCDQTMSDHFQASEAFAILSIVAALAGVIAAVLKVLDVVGSWMINLACSAAVFVFTLLVWAIMAGLYYDHFKCLGKKSIQEFDQSELNGGFGLFVLSWILSTLALVVSVVGLTQGSGNAMQQ